LEVWFWVSGVGLDAVEHLEESNGKRSEALKKNGVVRE
jgi:hypothetical protein